ncbi:MAG TPA: NUDIX domain-containing protein [Thermomicrobiales bacterium]|nr:NUDIX domain-containing protein [Thermomicrobiales bacterium]
MGEGEQFEARGRYTVIPRTLVFLRHGDDVLLLRGAPTKRLWANRYNGLGGHVEPGETVEAAARREVREESGIAEIDDFALRALVNLAGEPHGVLLCVFTGTVRSRAVVPSAEGVPEWVPVADLDRVDLVDDPAVIARILHADRLLYGYQPPDAAHFVLA